MVWFRQSVDSIIADFDKTRQRLLAHADVKHEEAANHDELVTHHQVQASLARTEKDRARQIASKLGELLK